MPINELALAGLPSDGLRDSKQQSRSWFEDNPLPMWYFDRRTLAFLDVNAAAAHLYGYTRKEFLAMTIKDIRRHKDVPVLMARMHAANRGRTKKALAQHRTKAGRLLDVEIYAQEMTFAGKSAELVQVHDITERKRAEESLRYLSGRLLQLQDEQKRQMARELHDAVGQMLTAILADLAIVNRTSRRIEPKTRKLLNDCTELAGEVLTEIRTLSYLLHPPLLDEEGLVAALELLLEGFSQRSGIKVALFVPADLGRLSQELETTLFRLVQEALANVHRHSESVTAEVRAFRAESDLVLEVRDRGKGIAPGAMEMIRRGASLGVGIAGMRERVTQLGGSLEIESNAGKTVIRATFPLHLQESRAA